jgi:hypothetical protein
MILPKQKGYSLIPLLFDLGLLEEIHQDQWISGWAVEEEDELAVETLLQGLSGYALSIKFFEFSHTSDEGDIMVELPFLVAQLLEKEYLGIMPQVRENPENFKVKKLDTKKHLLSKEAHSILQELSSPMKEINALYTRAMEKVSSSGLIYQAASSREEVIEKLLSLSVVKAYHYQGIEDKEIPDPDSPFKSVDDILLKKMKNQRVYYVGETLWNFIIMAETLEEDTLVIRTKAAYT